jgi:hypothetical protein
MFVFLRMSIFVTGQIAKLDMSNTSSQINYGDIINKTIKQK